MLCDFMKWQRGWIRIRGKRGAKYYSGRYRSSDEKQLTVNLGFVTDLTLTEARTKLEAIVREAGSRPQSARSITFDEYWQLHYKPRHRVSWSEPTEHGYDAYVRAYLNPVFGNVRLVDLDPGHVTAFFDRLRKEYSRTVVRKCWVMLKAIFEDVVDDDFIAKNPMRKVEYPKTKLPHKPVIDPALLPYVLKAVQDNPRDSAILHVGAFCAMRPAEVFGLRWRSVCGDHFLIRDSPWEGRLLADQAKVDERRAFIPTATREAILRWRKACQNVSPDALLFASSNGTPISAHNFPQSRAGPAAAEAQAGLRFRCSGDPMRHATRERRRTLRPIWGTSRS
jgi:integrase